MRKKFASIACAALISLLGLAGCSTNTQGDDASPVFLSVSFDLLPLDKNVATGTALQFSSTTLKSVFKVPPTGGQTFQFLDTSVDDYVVEWKRIDGGKTVPQKEVFGGNVLVPAGGTSNLRNYPFMSATALQRSPLDQLFPFNGGIDRETGRTEIRCAGIATFRGHTLSGQPVSGSGTFDMAFFYAPIAGTVTARPVK